MQKKENPTLIYNFQGNCHPIQLKIQNAWTEIDVSKTRCWI